MSGLRLPGAHALTLALAGALPLAAQGPAQGGTGSSPGVDRSEGFAATAVEVLQDWGWIVESRGDSVVATSPGGSRLTMVAGTPFVRVDNRVLQLADAPYTSDRALLVPIQLFRELALPVASEVAGVAPDATPETSKPPPETSERGAPASSTDSPYSSLPPATIPTRVVIIDAGHGGRDLGALGYGGTREKDVALGVALELAHVLETWPEYQVHLIRDDDEFVPLWERGGIATELKGAEPGVFLSLHVNSNPTSRKAEGFETFFLADARTEDERRLSALENAAVPMEGQSVGGLGGDDLGLILGELRNLDYQHWSAHLATLVQEELAKVHPGRNRGVSQAPLAALTTSLMPSVLVEVGYITNSDEEELLGRTEFRQHLAEAMARAVDRFFDGYPPGTVPQARTGSRP